MRLFDGAFRQIDAEQFATEGLAFEPNERQAAVLDGTLNAMLKRAGLK